MTPIRTPLLAQHRVEHRDPLGPPAERVSCSANDYNALRQWSQPGSNRRPLACKAIGGQPPAIDPFPTLSFIAL